MTSALVDFVPCGFSSKTKPQLCSLLDIMPTMFATNISSVFAEITQLAQVASTGGKGDQISLDRRSYIAEYNMLTVQLLCAELDLYQSLHAAQRLMGSLKTDDVFTNSELQWKLDNLRELMESEMRQHLYFRVENHLTRYINAKYPFGEEVEIAFPSIKRDLKEAGRCIAFDCNTAAVFHLMRIAEIGLWELGRDRQIPLAQNDKIEFSEWGVIIKEIEPAVKAIQQWPNSRSKEDAHKFYNQALEEIRALNDGWRRHVAHNRPNMLSPSPEDALAAWGHVQRLMKTLAEKISEGKYTSLKW